MTSTTDADRKLLDDIYDVIGDFYDGDRKVSAEALAKVRALVGAPSREQLEREIAELAEQVIDYDYDDPSREERALRDFADWVVNPRRPRKNSAAPQGAPSRERDESKPPPGYLLHPCKHHGQEAVQIVRETLVETKWQDGDLPHPDDVPEAIRDLWRICDAEHPTPHGDVRGALTPEDAKMLIDTLPPTVVLNLVKELTGRIACVHCGAIPPADEVHWEVCPNHPARQAARITGPDPKPQP